MPTDEGHQADLGERIDELLYRWEDMRRRPVVVVAILGAIVIIVLVAWLAMGSGSGDALPQIDDRIPMVTLAPTSPPATEMARLVVHVAGAVRSPGVYELTSGGRVVDAIQLAGGATPEGQPDRLNLAAPVTDGMQVRVPVEGEEVATAPTPEAAAITGPVDLNSATASQLESLPGVGPATAAAILAYRSEVGRFSSVSDLLGVRGIGEAKLEAIRDLVVVL